MADNDLGGEGEGSGTGTGEGEGSGEQTPFEVMRATFPADMRADPALDAWKDSGVEGMYKDWKGLSGLLGKEGSRVNIPAEDASDDDRAAFYNQLGRPEKVEDYNMGDFKSPEGVDWDPEFQTSMMATLHAAGLSNDHMRAVLDAYGQHFPESIERGAAADEKTVETTVASLKQEWGVNFEPNKEFAARVWKLAGEEMQGIKINGVLAKNHAGFVKFLAAVGQTAGEANFTDEERGGSGGAKTQEAALAEIASAAKNPEIQAILTNKDHHEHDAMRATQTALFKTAYPS